MRPQLRRPTAMGAADKPISPATGAMDPQAFAQALQSAMRAGRDVAGELAASMGLDARAVVEGLARALNFPVLLGEDLFACTALMDRLPLTLAVVYVSLLALHFHKDSGGFGSLAEVSRLFSNPYLLLAGWIHYLAFDLFTGCWMVRDSERLRVAHGFVVPCLLLTFLFGPTGLLTWFLIRTSLRGRAAVI